MSANASTPTQVLLIEDNPGDANLIQELLSEVTGIAFHFHLADRLSAALEQLGRVSADVVLLDISLPDSKGLDSLAKLHRHKPGLPIIVLTGREDELLGINAVREGAQDYLIKGQVTGDLLARSMRYAIERTHAQEQARELAREKERADLLNNIIRDMSHEFRTPLAIIQSSADSLGYLEQPEKRQIRVERIGAQVQRLTKVLEDMLALAELDRVSSLPQSPILLNQLVKETVAAIAPLVSKKNLIVIEKLDQSINRIPACRSELQRAVLKIAENAAIYTPEGGTLTFQTRRDGLSVMIEVIDTGIGIAPTDISHIFERLYRADIARSVQSSGVGLGLSITKRIMELHGGKIEGQSVLGQGSTFRLVLPDGSHQDTDTKTLLISQ